MSANPVNINGQIVGSGHPPYIIAEMSGNHNGDLQRALALVEEAKTAGADAIKLQTYTADSITINHDSPEFKIKEGLWDGYTLYELYKEAHTPREWHKKLFDKAQEIGLTAFSSPFDATAIEFLEELDCPAYKIASFEIVDLPLIESAARTGKPLILSTGMADEIEIWDAVHTARSAGCRDLILLHCVSGYPTPPDELNLLTIPDMADRFNVSVGLSDHTLGMAASVCSISLGACIIEKHFTLNRTDGGPDAAFSLEPNELKTLVNDCRDAWSALGNANYLKKQSEHSNLKFRRSVYVVEDIKEGDVFNNSNVRIIRPGYGMAPKNLKNILGKQAVTDLPRGTALKTDHIKFISKTDGDENHE